LFSFILAVGGPLEKSCRLEGILDTVVHRGIDLQKELDENKRIEDSIRQEIEAEFQNEPNHPIVTEAPQVQETVENKETREPTTPTGKSIDGCSSKDLTRTPDLSPDSGVMFSGMRMDNGLAFANPAATFPFSPNSIDNADLGAVGLPAYRRNAGLDDGDFYGCGAASFLGNHVRLFPGTQQPESPMRNADGNENRLRTTSHDGHFGLTPTLTSSFDTVDFRTGLSGHRGLNNAKKSHPGYSPNTRSGGSSGRLMMSEHRGIGRARGPLNRSAASNSPSP